MQRQTAFDPVRAYLTEKYWGKERRYFAYGMDFNTLASSAVAQSESFVTDLTADFLCLSIVEVITTDAAGGTEQSFPEHLVQISSDTGGTFWGTGFQHAANLFGRMAVNGPGVFELPYPQFVPGGTTVTARINNLEANARRVWMSFHGVHIFKDRERR